MEVCESLLQTFTGNVFRKYRSIKYSIPWFILVSDNVNVASKEGRQFPVLVLNWEGTKIKSVGTVDMLTIIFIINQ